MSQDTSRQCLRMDTGAVQRPSERRRDLEAWADACVRWGRRARTEGGLTPRWDLNLWLALSRALALSLSFPFLLSPARAWARPPPLFLFLSFVYFFSRTRLSLSFFLLSPVFVFLFVFLSYSIYISFCSHFSHSYYFLSFFPAFLSLFYFGWS